MSLTDAEIIELEYLLEEQKKDDLIKGLTTFTSKTSPNYKFLYESINTQKWGFDNNGKPELISGYAGCVLEGSSRSTKTWSGIDIIIYLCTQKHKSESVTINIYRETYNEFKTTLYDDFKRRLDDFCLDNPFHKAKEVRSFKINKSTVYFLGDGKHGGGCDYAFYNEAMMIDKSVFDQSEMRCRKFWWMDYNPSFTDHWVFDNVIPRSDVGFLRTTFKDNPFISATELNKILGYEPYLPGSYTIEDSELIYNYDVVSEKNLPPPHPKNIDSGTADEFMWKVYGLGLRGAMKGVIFPYVTWIDKFPDVGYIYGNDFGFTNDPNVTVKYSEDEKNIYLEPLIYQPIDNPEELSNCLEAVGVEKDMPISCDSSDKYTGENKGTVEMTRGLQNLGWEAQKVRKTKSVMFWLTSMKTKKIHIVRNHLYQKVKKEKENYKFKEVNGIPINQPEDAYNHFWDASRYAHIAWNESKEMVSYWN